MRILSVVGARPQFVKYFPLSSALRARVDSHGDVEDVLVHTGQHYDYALSKQFFDQFGLKEPRYHLDVGSSSHGRQTGNVLARTEEVLLQEKPDVTVVFGDTNSTLGAALAAVKLQIPVVHVEAGLRSHNRRMPEEINRVTTDHVSSLLLCPSGKAVDNLAREGLDTVIDRGRLLPPDRTHGAACDLNVSEVAFVGDIMYDVLQRVRCDRPGVPGRDSTWGAEDDCCLLTLHRQENTSEPERFRRMLDFVKEWTGQRTVVFPVHPRTGKLFPDELDRLPSRFRVIEPVGYFEMIELLERCSLVLTDSGGLQKEAFWLRVPCVTLRDETEWVETVESGWNVLYRDYAGSHDPIDDRRHCYGDGNAAERIVALLTNAR